MKYSDQEIVVLLSKDDRDIFEYLFRHYYTALNRFSLKYVRSEELAEEVVQEVFLYIWEKRHTLKITSSLNAYLYAAVRNRSISQINAQLTRLRINEEFKAEVTTDPKIEKQIDQPMLKQLVATGIQNLPERCRIIFSLSRNSGMTYQEIAEELNLSKKTVEAQMGIALKKLRIYLNTHWDKITLLLLGLGLHPWFIKIISGLFRGIPVLC
ncbi:MAG: RNA polymerase sigma-70 factor [Cyclobacteriaceae bacterium]